MLEKCLSNTTQDLLDCDNPRELAKSIIKINQVTGMSFASQNQLLIETKNCRKKSMLLLRQLLKVGKKLL